MFNLLPHKTILRLSQLFNSFAPPKNKISEIFQKFDSDQGLLARSVSDAKAEEMIFSPRAFRLHPCKRLTCLSLLTKVEEIQEEKIYSQSLLVRNTCPPSIHFYSDDIRIQCIHPKDIDLSGENPKKLTTVESILEERKKQVLLIRKNKGDISICGKNWLTGDICAKVNEVRALVNPLQKIAFGVMLNREDNQLTAFFTESPPLSQLGGNELMDKVGILKAILDMLYSSIEDVKNYERFNPCFTYTRGHLLLYHPTPADLVIFLQAANDILKNPEFYRVFYDDTNCYSGCARVFLRSVEAIKQAGEQNAERIAWQFGLFGRTCYSIGKKITNLACDENLLTIPRC
jgi:hypothetical protein